jgi:hypothetical protein
MASLLSRLGDLITAIGADMKLKANLASPTFTGTVTVPRLVQPPVVVTYAASITLNAALGNTQRVTMTGDATFLAPTNPADGQTLTLVLTASGGARTPTFTVGSAGAFKYGSDITGVTAVASGTTDIIGLRYNSAADRWWIVAVVKGY